MSLATRRVIAGVFIFAFFIIGPLMIFYARGYRYSWDSQTINATGTLIISSTPSRANVFLNDETVAGQTPLTLTALPPRQYAIRLDSPGYHSWEKTLSVKQDQATFVTSVRLLKNEIPTTFVTGAISPLASSADHQYLVYWKLANPNKTLGDIFLLNTNEQQATKITPSTISEPRLAEWSADHRYVAILTATELLTYDTILNQLKRSPIKEPYSRLRWSEASLYLFGETTLAEATSATNWTPQSRIVPSSDEMVFDRFAQSSNTYVVIKRDHDYQLQVNQANATKRDLVFFNNQPFLYRGGWDDILVFQTAAGEMKVARYDNGNLFTLLEEPFVSALDIDTASQTLAYATEFELWTYSPASDTKTLLTRLGTTITAVNVFLSSHVFYKTENEIWAIERDGRDVRSRWKLATFTDAKQIFLSADSSTLFLNGTIGSLSGIFLLSL